MFIKIMVVSALRVPLASLMKHGRVTDQNGHHINVLFTLRHHALNCPFLIH
jgi:hypothetical protein